MSHYAKVLNGKVIEVIVAEISFFDNFIDSSPGDWIQTSYNTRGGIHYAPNSWEPDDGEPLRGNYAGIGYTYDSVNDVFYPPRPLDKNGLSCNSWTIGAPTWLWEPPISIPSDAGTGEPPKIYAWDEPSKNWILIQ
jgi:hypothetical protein